MTSGPSADGPFRTLPLDARAERGPAMLRLAGAIVVTICAALLVVLRPPMPIWAWAVVGLGLLVAIAWLAMFAKARRRLRSPEQHVLELRPDAIVLVEGAKESRVPWADVEAVSVDEDRLVVQVQVRGAAPLSVEPRYGGLGVYDLEAAVRRAFEAAQATS